MKRLAFAAACFLAAAGATPALAGYVADFDTTGSAADFAVVYSQNVQSPAITEVLDGDKRLNITGTAAAATTNAGTQFRMAVAPANAPGSYLGKPSGLLNDSVRTEARLSLKVESRTPGDDPATEQPFTSFGFVAWDSALGTADYGDKFLVQINADLNQITLSDTNNSTAAPGTADATYAFPGGVAIPSGEFELQITADQMRLLLDGTPLIPDGASSEWVALDVDLGADFTGDTLMPFVGVIRGGVLEAGDTIGAGFDNIRAVNVAVPEPASLGLLALAGVTLARRRR